MTRRKFSAIPQKSESFKWLSHIKNNNPYNTKYVV